eukprot:284119_1
MSGNLSCTVNADVAAGVWDGVCAPYCDPNDIENVMSINCGGEGQEPCFAPVFLPRAYGLLGFVNDFTLLRNANPGVNGTYEFECKPGYEKASTGSEYAVCMNTAPPISPFTPVSLYLYMGDHPEAQGIEVDVLPSGTETLYYFQWNGSADTNYMPTAGWENTQLCVPVTCESYTGLHATDIDARDE